MLTPDIPVWWRFLDRNKDLFLNLYYDVYLGGPFMSEADMKDPMKRMWWASTSKRADAVAELKDEIWIIEVSDYPGMRAVGQLITYQTLWLEDQVIQKIERLCLVCSRIDADLGAALAKIGCLIFVMP